MQPTRVPRFFMAAAAAAALSPDPEAKPLEKEEREREYLKASDELQRFFDRSKEDAFRRAKAAIAIFCPCGIRFRLLQRKTVVQVLPSTVLGVNRSDIPLRLCTIALTGVDFYRIVLTSHILSRNSNTRLCHFRSLGTCGKMKGREVHFRTTTKKKNKKQRRLEKRKLLKKME